jgi:hypothetical protein
VRDRYTLWPIRPYAGLWEEAREWRAQCAATRPDWAALEPEMDRLIVQGDYTLLQAYQMAQWERDHEED